MGVAAGVVWAPWVLSTAINTGNPVYPWAFSIFGGSPDGAFAWDTTASEINTAAAALGAGWNPIKWITAPVEVWTEPLGFGALPRIGPNLLLVFPFLFWALRRSGSKRERALAIAALGFYLFWSVTARNARFLLPVMALGLAVVGFALARAFERKRVHRLLAVGLIAGLLAWDLTSAVSSFSNLLKPGAFLSGKETHAQYMDARRRPSKVFRWASTSLPSDARVLLIGETRSLGLERDRLVGGALDPSPLLWLEEKTGADGFVEAVRRSDITHVVFDGPQAIHLAERRKRYRGRQSELPELKRWLDSEGRLLFEDKAIQVYELDRVSDKFP